MTSSIEAFGRKAARALEGALNISSVLCQPMTRRRQSTLYFYTVPVVQAEIRKQNRPVLPLQTGERWLHVAIDLHAIAQERWRVNHISISVLQGDVQAGKRMLLRAEWQLFEEADNSGHGQPHWHVMAPPSAKSEPDFEAVVAESTEFAEFLATAEADNASAEHQSTDAVFDHFHYAMVTDWHATPSVGPIRTLDDEAAALAWLRGCAGYIVHQLAHVDRKLGAAAA